MKSNCQSNAFSRRKYNKSNVEQKGTEGGVFLFFLLFSNVLVSFTSNYFHRGVVVGFFSSFSFFFLLVAIYSRENDTGSVRGTKTGVKGTKMVLIDDVQIGLRSSVPK